MVKIMLDIITKQEYFSWLDQGYGTQKANTLKGIQDSFILSQLAVLQNNKIAEIGGGQSRVLTILSEKNECWNVDKLEGVGSGPQNYKEIPGVKLVKAYMGEYSSDLLENYFDIVFSISVVEHVNPEYLAGFFKDMARILKNGGLCIHAIDVYLGDSEYIRKNPQIDIYRTVGKENGIPLEFIDQPQIDATSVFSCRYASNSDMCMYNWNKSVPGLVNVRNNSQSVSIKAVWEKS
jgi:SAM-dependent methyltransferase